MKKKRLLSLVMALCLMVGSATALPEGIFTDNASITASAASEKQIVNVDFYDNGAITGDVKEDGDSTEYRYFVLGVLIDKNADSNVVATKDYVGQFIAWDCKEFDPKTNPHSSVEFDKFYITHTDYKNNYDRAQPEVKYDASKHRFISRVYRYWVTGDINFNPHVTDGVEPTNLISPEGASSAYIDANLPYYLGRLVNYNEQSSDVVPEYVSDSILCISNLNCISGKKTTLTGTFTPSKKESLDKEIAAIKVSCDSDKLQIGKITHLNSSDNSNATIFLDVTAKTHGDFSIFFSLPDSNTKQEVRVYAEPELILPGSSAGNVYNHYANLTVDCNGEGDIITKNITFNVSIDEADKQYLESFLKSIEVSTLKTSELTAHAKFDSSYSIAEDGKSASFIVSVFCGRSNINDYISVKTPAQSKVLCINRNINNGISIENTWGFSNNNVSGDLTYQHYRKFFNPIRAIKLYDSDHVCAGYCAGLVTSAVASFAYNAPYVNTFTDSNGKSAKKLSDIKDVNTKSMNYTAGDIVKYAYVYQKIPKIQEEKENNKNNLDKLYNAVKESINSRNEYIEIAVRGEYMSEDKGHLLLALEIVKDDENEVQIRVYDCNCPGDEDRIVKLKRENGKLVSWEFQIFKSNPHLIWGTGKKYSEISYTTSGEEFAHDMFSNEWKDLNEKYSNLLTINNPGVTIKTKNKSKVLKIENSNVSETENGCEQYWIESEDGLVISNGDTKNSFDITNDKESVKAIVESNAIVSLETTKSKGKIVSIDNSKCNDFSVSFVTYSVNGNDLPKENEICITGNASTSKATVSINEDQMILSGIDKASIKSTKNNTVVSSIDILSYNHNVMVIKKNDSTLSYVVDYNDDDKYDKNDLIIERLSGDNRFSTAVAISKASYPNGADTVILAFGLNYADALAGVPLATKLNAPILLTAQKSLPTETLAEIKRLKAKNVIILGGTGAIDTSVEKALNQDGIMTDRIAGKTRFETATKIADRLQKLNGKKPEEVFFVYALNFADALSVSAVAAAKNAPIIYLQTNGNLDDTTKNYLGSIKNSVKKAYVIGGTGVISNDMMKKAGNTLGVTPIRVFGKDRFETCVAVNEKFADVLNGDSISIATGMDFPDALAGGVFAAMNKSPLFLINGKVKTFTLNESQKSYLKIKLPKILYVFGGTGAVPNSHIQTVAKAS